MVMALERIEALLLSRATTTIPATR
eukprot:SAG31_NODE_35654_length_321_cov_0.693694_1_plen_25_part_01